MINTICCDSLHCHIYCCLLVGRQISCIYWLVFLFFVGCIYYMLVGFGAEEPHEIWSIHATQLQTEVLQEYSRYQPLYEGNSKSKNILVCATIFFLWEFFFVRTTRLVNNFLNIMKISKCQASKVLHTTCANLLDLAPGSTLLEDRKEIKNRSKIDEVQFSRVLLWTTRRMNDLWNSYKEKYLRRKISGNLIGLLLYVFF